MSVTETMERLRENHLPSREDMLTDVAADIHAHPEIRFTERHAASRLTHELEQAGFTVQRGFAGLDTAFVGRWSTPDATDQSPAIAFFCEYDALEDIGHACGHNIIAASGLGGGVLTKDALEAEANTPAHVVVIGSPGEEGAAGKVPMIEGGVLEDIDLAMMVHPAGWNDVGFQAMARVALDVDFTGKASHAAASPEEGINALDAVTLSLTAIGLLRQQTVEGSRIHSIVTNGGQAPNIIPESAGLRVFVRASERDYLMNTLVPQVQRCFEGAALATGCQVNIAENTPAYLSMVTNPVLARLAREGFAAVGRTEDERHGASGSTDMGNVSHVVPSMHPMLNLATGVPNHTREFTTAAGGPNAAATIVDGALILASTALECFWDPGLIEQAQAAFSESVGR